MTNGTFLSAEWRYLAMLNYEVDPALLQPYVPRGTELDDWHGRTYLSVVGFLFLQTRLLGWPVPWHRDFEEINLRFYVRHRGAEGWRRGVVFIKEIVPKPAITTVARTVYNERYVTRPMRHRVDLDSVSRSPTGSAEYGWRDQGRWHHLAVQTVGAPQPLVAGSLEEFIAEHYWGYVTQRDGGCMEYRVEHPPWRIWRVGDAFFDCQVDKVYGEQFAEYLSPVPGSALLAEGSPVVVQWGRRI